MWQRGKSQTMGTRGPDDLATSSYFYPCWLHPEVRRFELWQQCHRRWLWQQNHTLEFWISVPPVNALHTNEYEHEEWRLHESSIRDWSSFGGSESIFALLMEFADQSTGLQNVPWSSQAHQNTKDYKNHIFRWNFQLRRQDAVEMFVSTECSS